MGIFGFWAGTNHIRGWGWIWDAYWALFVLFLGEVERLLLVQLDLRGDGWVSL